MIYSLDEREEGKMDECEQTKGNKRPPKISERNFIMSTSKTFEKFQEASNRPTFKIEYNRAGDGCIIVSRSPGGYQLFKNALKEHFLKLFSQGLVDLREGRDMNNSQIDVSISVYRKGDTRSQERLKMYTINLYHTTNRAMINGKEHQEFSDSLREMTQNMSLGLAKSLTADIIDNISTFIIETWFCLQLVHFMFVIVWFVSKLHNNELTLAIVNCLRD
jgi:hypothetical protein